MYNVPHPWPPSRLLFHPILQSINLSSHPHPSIVPFHPFSHLSVINQSIHPCNHLSLNPIPPAINISIYNVHVVYMYVYLSIHLYLRVMWWCNEVMSKRLSHVLINLMMTSFENISIITWHILTKSYSDMYMYMYKTYMYKDTCTCTCIILEVTLSYL